MKPAALSGPLAAAVALILLAPPSAAFQQVEDFGGTRVSVPWPAGLGSSGSFGRGASADLTGDGIPEAILLDGATAVVLAGIDAYWAPSELQFAANDVDAVPASGDPGAFVAVNGLGLVGIGYDAVASAFTETVLDASWSGAALVRAADLDGDGHADLLGLAGDRTTFLRQQGSAGALTFSAAPGFAVTNLVREFTLVQWDADADLEVAVLTDYGLELFELDGTLVDLWPSVVPGGVIATLSQAGQTTDRVAWITAYAPPAAQWLMSISPNGVEDLVDLGALDAFAAAAGDFDLDGDDDLLVSHHYSHELLWFENIHTPADPYGPCFSDDPEAQSLFRVGPPDTPGTLNEAWPIVDDLDGDGDLDVLYAVETSATLELIRAGEVTEDDQRPTPAFLQWDLPDQAPEGTLRFEIHAPAAIPAGATHVAVNLWRSTGYGADFASDALETHLVPVTGAWPLSVDLTIPESTSVFLSIYGIQTRFVGLDGSGSVGASFPAFAGFYATDPATIALLEAEATGPSIPVILAPSGNPDPVGNGGSVTGSSQMGGFGSGAPPSGGN